MNQHVNSMPILASIEAVSIVTTVLGCCMVFVSIAILPPIAIVTQLDHYEIEDSGWIGFMNFTLKHLEIFGMNII